MKSSPQFITGISVALLIGCASSQAGNWSDSFYVHTDIGAAFTPDATTHVLRFDPSFGPVRSQGTFKSDPGIRGDLALGYNLTKSLGLELESGVIWNDGPGDDNTFYQIPVMLNAVYQVRLSDSWKVYFGAGAGEVLGSIHFVAKDAAFHTPFVFDASDWSFGYQAQAGIKYSLSRHVDIDLGYRFLAVDGYDFTFSRFNPIAAKMTVDDLFVHSAQVSFTWKF
jgi:opacity protein-like surface antigen